MISGVKNGEDGGYIIRLSDYAGVGGEVTLTLSDLLPEPAHAEIVDITERHVLAPCKVNGRSITLTLDPFAMATVRIG